MINVELLDDEVLSDISDNLSLDVGNEEDMKLISEMSVGMAFERYLRWNGIIGYGELIMNALDSIRKASDEHEPGRD